MEETAAARLERHQASRFMQGRSAQHQGVFVGGTELASFEHNKREPEGSLPTSTNLTAAWRPSLVSPHAASAYSAV